MNWNATQTTLGDETCFRTLNGLWKGKKPPFVEAGVIRNTNFTESGRIDFDNIAWLEVEEKQLAKRQLEAGDIIIERSGGGPKQPVGRVVFFDRNDGRFSFSNFTSAIRVGDRAAFDAKFVFYSLLELYQSGQTEDLQRRTTGIRNLDFSAYKERAVFPRIPLPEQRKIAGVLGLVQRAMEQQERLIEKTAELKKTLLHQLFTQGTRGEPQKQTDLGPVPESWEVTLLRDCAVVQTGAAKGRNFKEKETVDLPYLRVANVQSGYLDLTEMKTITIQVSEKPRFLLHDGDVVLTEGGDFDKLGRGFIWRGQVRDCVHQNHIFAVRVDRKRLLPDFFAHLSQSHYGKTFFLSVAHKTTNLACINTTKLKAFPVLVPSLEEQREIVQVIESADSKLAHHRRKHATLSALFRTLLHQLMTAQLRVHDLDLDGILEQAVQETDAP